MHATNKITSVCSISYLTNYLTANLYRLAREITVCGLNINNFYNAGDTILIATQKELKTIVGAVVAESETN